MMVHEKKPLNHSEEQCDNEAGCLYALITGRRSVSRRNRASWYLRQLNKVVRCDTIEDIEEDLGQKSNTIENTTNDESGQEQTPDDIPDDNKKKDIFLVSITSSSYPLEIDDRPSLTKIPSASEEKYLVTPNTSVLYLSKIVATSIILDLSPSVVSVSPQNDCVFLDSMFDALKRVLHLLVKSQEVPSSLSSSGSNRYILTPKVFISVIAYTPFIIAKSNQVLVQNRGISLANIDQVLTEIWSHLTRLTREIYELVTSTCGINLDYEAARSTGTAFIFPQPASSSVIRHPGSVLEDIYELGLFSCSLMPRLSRLSIVIITDGLFASTNNLNIFRLKSIAVSFVSLGAETVHPDACFGYTPYTDLMKFVSKSTQGFYISHQTLIECSLNYSRTNKQILLMNNPLYKLFSWTLHSEIQIDDRLCSTPKACNNHSDNNNTNFVTNSDALVAGMKPEYIAKFFCVDQPVDAIQSSPIMGGGDHLQPFLQQNDLVSGSNYHDWRYFKQMDRNLDADFEQALSCLLREGYLIKSIQFKHRDSLKIVARLVLHWKHNLDLEQELTAPYRPTYLNDNNSLIMRPFNVPQYGDTYCEIFVHGSYSFLHNLYCDRKTKRRSEYRDIAYRQFRQLIEGVKQTHDRLQYLSRFYRDSSLSKIPPMLSHGNSLFYNDPQTQRLDPMVVEKIDNINLEFQEYWRKISCLETRSWKNLMHVHTLRLVLEHDQPKHKNIHCQNANGRYNHIQCRRALSGISNFIKNYATFALLEDTTYVKLIYNKEDDLREIETSATKGFIVIRINKLLPLVVIYLMFTSGILDSNRVQIVNYLEEKLINCKLEARSGRISTITSADDVLHSKSIYPSSDSCCIRIKSPLEKMLRVYSRNFIGDLVAHNLTIGLPGSYPSLPMPMQQSFSRSRHSSEHQHQQQHHHHHHHHHQHHHHHHQINGLASIRSASNRNDLSIKDPYLDDQTAENSINRYNLVFGKYLYGVRVVHTLGNLPHSAIHPLVSDVLAKISAILVNVRIIQGFHIAFNNSGIMNLVVELDMEDQSYESHTSDCLCQYILFPPTITNCTPPVVATTASGGGPSALASQHVANVTSGANLSAGQQAYGSASTTTNANSKPESLSGSLANSDHIYMIMNHSPSSPTMRNQFTGEVKIIREYWIEQQYGISMESKDYHKSLQNMRYTDIVDHLFVTDTKIFDCLLTFDLLLALCDNSNTYKDLDIALTQVDSSSRLAGPIFSPTNSSSTDSASNNLAAGPDTLAPNSLPTSPSSLPSSLIEGNTKEGISKLPLLEFDYEFSLVRFFEYCQQVDISVLLFQDGSEFFDPTARGDNNTSETVPVARDIGEPSEPGPRPSANTTKGPRKISVDMNSFDSRENYNYMTTSTNRREAHRSSHDDINSNNNLVHYQTLNHQFLDILYSKLNRLSDKELALTDSDRKRLSEYLIKHRYEPMGHQDANKSPQSSAKVGHKNEETISSKLRTDMDTIEWRCFLRKCNQDNLMIVLVPAKLNDVTKWNSLLVNGVSETGADAIDEQSGARTTSSVCPMFVFRASSEKINELVLKFINDSDDDDEDPSKHRLNQSRSRIDGDLEFHFGRSCDYMGKFKQHNDELGSELLKVFEHIGRNQTATTTNGPSAQILLTKEDESFYGFLKKLRNTVLKSRFNALHEAYDKSNLFIHKDDVLYYIREIDQELQKKYHVSSNLKNLAEFVRSYEAYVDSLPKEPSKPCNQLLNSILLQKCGLFINQPIARFNEANPLLRKLTDRRLLFFMRCNFKFDLPILEGNLAQSTLLKGFIKPSISFQAPLQPVAASSISEATASGQAPSTAASGQAGISSSLGKSGAGLFDGIRLMDSIKSGSMGANGSSSNLGSPSSIFKPQVSATSTAGPSPRFISCSSSSNLNINHLSSPTNDSFILEAFRRPSCPIDEIPVSYLKGSDVISADDISLRHEAHMAEVLKRKSERKESHQYRRVLKSRSAYNQSHSAIDQALKRVDSLGRLEHFCLTPLLFSPTWRSKLAPVRDHTIAAAQEDDLSQRSPSGLDYDGPSSQGQSASNPSPDQHHQQQASTDNDERWHQTVCNNYIKEYEQYIQTLGFHSVQIRYSSSLNSKSMGSIQNPSRGASSSSRKSSRAHNSSHGSTIRSSQSRRESLSLASNASNLSAGSTTTTIINNNNNNNNNSSSHHQASLPPAVTSLNSYNTGYLIKFLNSGCLVFKVGFCKPYVYSILYSIEGERFNDTNVKMNMTTFLDELDNIKLTMHLHSFTYDYHLRSIYSYIAGRQMTFSPGYHLISFVDDFRKYYQKAPNYARNRILGGEINITDLKVSGQQLYNYIVTHNQVYDLDILEMSSSLSTITSHFISSIGANSQYYVASTSTGGGGGGGIVATSRSAFSDSLMRQSSATDYSPTGVVGGSLLGSNKDDVAQQINNSSRSHANDYVLIELKREKVRYRDGKDPDVFDCGLLITHDVQSPATSCGQPNGAVQSSNCLTLKYFLLLTNQRDLYPKLIHSDDMIIDFGCHRPIRFGMASNQIQANSAAGGGGGGRQSAIAASKPGTGDEPTATGGGDFGRASKLALPQHGGPAPPSSVSTVSTGDMDQLASTDMLLLLSSGEHSGPQSIVSTATSVQSSSQDGTADPNQSGSGEFSSLEAAAATTISRNNNMTPIRPQIQLPPEEATDALQSEAKNQDPVASAGASASGQLGPPTSPPPPPPQSARHRHLSTGSSSDGQATSGADQTSSANPTSSNKTNDQARSSGHKRFGSSQEQVAICDEEITYLGYFSSDEMDMLKFLQEKTASLKSHIEQVVRQAEVHYRRDYLWHKLMQRTQPEITSSLQTVAAAAAGASSGGLASVKAATSLLGSDASSNALSQLPLSVDELTQLLHIVEAIDLASLDPQLSMFTTLSVDWYLKLTRAFTDLKQSGTSQHRIFTVRLQQQLQQQQQPQQQSQMGNKSLLLFIDPKCATAFILMSIDCDRGCIELNLLLKDSQECCTMGPPAGSGTTNAASNDQAPTWRPNTTDENSPASATGLVAQLELDLECRQLIEDFVNFCATFMWSTLLM